MCDDKIGRFRTKIISKTSSSDEVFFSPFIMLEALYQIFLRHPQVTTDSRRIGEGSIFFALKGDNFNGNAFALSALEKGAAYAVVDEAEFAVNDKILLVENVLQTLQALGRYHRQKMGIPILAITGTNAHHRSAARLGIRLFPTGRVSAAAPFLVRHVHFHQRHIFRGIYPCVPDVALGNTQA